MRFEKNYNVLISKVVGVEAHEDTEDVFSWYLK